jgi:hypothetical protein
LYNYPLGLGFVGFSPQNLDTIIVQQYNDSGYTQMFHAVTIADTAVQVNNDTASRHLIILSEGGYYQITIPATGNIYKVYGIFYKEDSIVSYTSNQPCHNPNGNMYRYPDGVTVNGVAADVLGTYTRYTYVHR